MEYHILASGSKGNSIFIYDQGNGLLIDCGISKRQLYTKLNQLGFHENDIHYVLLTHDHVDHNKNIGIFDQSIVYCGKGCIPGIDESHEIENYQDITQNTLDLSAFIENYKNNKNSKYTEQNNQIIMETTALAENKYQKYEKLYISKETGKPEKMEIKDTNQNTIIYIIYNEININTYNANLTHTNIRSECYGNKKRRYVLC